MANAAQNVRDRLRELMERDQKNASEVAALLGHKPQWLSQFLSGKRNVPLSSLDKIATLFKVEPWQLVSPDPVRHGSTTGSSRETATPAETRLLEVERRETRGALFDIYSRARAVLVDLGDIEKVDRTQPDQAGLRRRDSRAHRRHARTR